MIGTERPLFALGGSFFGLRLENAIGVCRVVPRGGFLDALLDHSVAALLAVVGRTFVGVCAAEFGLGADDCVVRALFARGGGETEGEKGGREQDGTHGWEGTVCPLKLSTGDSEVGKSPGLSPANGVFSGATEPVATLESGLNNVAARRAFWLRQSSDGRLGGLMDRGPVCRRLHKWRGRLLNVGWGDREGGYEEQLVSVGAVGPCVALR